MARNLGKAGHQLTIWNRTREREGGIGSDGRKRSGRGRKSCGSRHTMLADDHAAEIVVFSDNWLLQGLPKGAIHILLSTISVEFFRPIWKAREEQEKRYVAGPVFGRPEAAAAAKLFIVTAGKLEVLKKSRYY